MSLTIKQQALTRPRFDDFHQQDDQRITSYAANYYTNPPEINCPVSYPTDPTVRLQKSGASWPVGQWKTDVESDLKNLGRFSTRVRCDDRLYNPDTNTINQIPLMPAPDDTAGQSFQRVVNPPCTLRATGWNRWESLPHQPQLTFETPFDYFIPSRTIDKEKCKTHRG
jgi:hypothetical protein